MFRIQIQHADRNVGPAAYREFMTQNRLLVSHSFYTIQGEGPEAGTPAYFIRLAGCNLGDKSKCQFCDASFEFDKGKPFTAEQIAELIAWDAPKVDLIVVTGGEPLLQWETLLKVMPEVNKINDKQYKWHFETNGILLTEKILNQASIFTRFIVSPKIVGKHYAPLPIELANEYPNEIVFKFIVSSDMTNPYHHLPTDIGKLRDNEIYISGMTEYGQEDVITEPGKPISLFSLSADGQFKTALNYAYAAKLALEHNYKTSYQTHLLAGVE